MTRETIDPTPYLDVPLWFHHYYKYTFTFRGTLGDRTIEVQAGGDSGDTYRMEVEADKVYTLRGGCDGYRFDPDSLRVTDLPPALPDRTQRLEAALVRLRDCDFVITPADRMDAVRAVAREALRV